MVSWDIKAKFQGFSPHIQELTQLAKQEQFSNIEQIKYLGNKIHRLTVNNRGIQQTEFITEKLDP